MSYVVAYKNDHSDRWVRTNFVTDDIVAARKERDRRQAKLPRLSYSVRDDGNLRSGHDFVPTVYESTEDAVRRDATILAALRYYERRFLRRQEVPHADIMDIASRGGRAVPLTAGEVEELCEKIGERV